MAAERKDVGEAQSRPRVPSRSPSSADEAVSMGQAPRKPVGSAPAFDPDSMQFRPVDARPGMLANPHVQQWTRGAEETAGTREAAKTEQDTRFQSFDAGRAGPSTTKKRTAPTKANKTASTKRAATATKKVSKSKAAARTRKSPAKKTTASAKASKKTDRRST